MIYKKIPLNSFNDKASNGAFLEIYLHENYFDQALKYRPAMVVVPGGAFFSIAGKEMETVALRYLSEGFNCFVISYAINKPYPVPHLDLAVAVLYIKTHEKEFGLDGHLFQVGFSAGGYLVGSYSYLYKELADTLDINPDVLRPDGIILSYPVISFVNHPHIVSRKIITGNDESLFEKFSIEKNVTKDYPPTFIWTTSGDTGVDPENTKVMIDALKNNGVAFDSFIAPNLNHGQSVETIEVRGKFVPFTEDELICKQWIDKSINFICNNFYKGE